MQVHVTDKVAKSMGMARVFKDNQAKINSIDFHRTEDLLITGSDDDSIHIYNIASGQQHEVLFSKKYGVQNICFTHHSSTAIYATRKVVNGDHALRYHDLRRNEYLRYYRGHSGPINMLCMSPKLDTFMSASQDKTVRLWDIRTNICQGILHVPGNPTANFDQQGLVFAVATESGMLKLYDVRSYDKGPFDTFVVQEEVNSPMMFADVKFSNDGKHILAVVEGKIYVLDAFTGGLVRRFTNGIPEAGSPVEASFSADNQYVLSGCEDRSIRVWSIQSGNEVAAWHGHAGVPGCLKWAPRRLLVASACQALVLWLPNMQALEGQLKTNP